jgi:pimeloyl-ACP methyl ester carboxylesterase
MRASTWIAVALAVFGLGIAPAAADARPLRPDLVVSKGTVVEKQGTLAGSFVVRNSGRVDSRRSSAALTVRYSGRTRVVKRFSVPKLEHADGLRVRVALKVPSGLPAGSLALRVCTDTREVVRESSERNNCRRVGTLVVAAQGTSRPKDPVPYQPDTGFKVVTPETKYWTYVPDSYDRTNATPTSLLVWLHGCGGRGEGDIDTVAPSDNQDYIAIAVGGREGLCWEMEPGPALVLAAVADVKTHFNIDPRRVILAGYSSGGDLAYRTAFYNARLFAGVLAENTSPFSDNGLIESQAIAAADWKFNVVQLAHTEDDTYPIATVRDETNALRAAGFPVTLIERPGGHYDEDTDTTGTDHDLRTLLLPHMDDGWLAPPG